MIVAVFWMGPAIAAEPLTLASPDGRLVASIAIGEESRPVYELRFDGRVVLTRSRLGLAFERYQQLSAGMAMLGSGRRSGEDAYQPVAGKTSSVRDAYNELVLSLAETGGEKRRLDIVFRAYDDGFAFRYRIPPQPHLRHLRLAGEATEFAFPADYACQAFNVGRFGTSHEGEFDPVRASQIRYHQLLDLPVVCQAAGGGPAMAFAEADLRDYAGLYLSGRETGEVGLQARLSPQLDDPGIAVSAWVGDQGYDTPWRVVMIGDRLGKLVESTLIASLNPAPKGDFSWVKPGKYAWDWWNGPTLAGVAKAGMNDETLRAFIDFAAESGLEYMLIDDGWYVNSGGGATVLPGANNLESISDVDLPALVRYAADRQVGLWLWVHWKLLDANMEEALPLYARLGIKGIKVDFMDRDDQEMVAFYHRLMKTAAANRLMVDLHGAYPPRGLARTYPNFLTQEGVFGAEYNKWTRRVTARHNVDLALTRMLLGPMDYTPGGFRHSAPASFRAEAATPMVQTTRGQALAMYVVYESPFQGVSDSPDNYRGQSGFEFVGQVPASWDETRVISAALGEQVAIARRKGEDWYIGAMTNEQGRSLTVPLSFLPPGAYRATIWQDGSGPADVTREERAVRAGDRLRLRLAPSGGAAVRISPARAPDRQGWQSLFDGRTLTGWTPKITGFALGEDPLGTFAAKDGAIRVSYARYDRFAGRFGHLAYRTPFSAYRIRLEYRFSGHWLPDVHDWQQSNSGIMLHAQPPETMTRDQNFPVSIEVQLLGAERAERSPSGNLCTPGTHVVMAGKLEKEHCIKSSSPIIPNGRWVKAEVEVDRAGNFTHFIEGAPVLRYSAAQYDPDDADARPLIALAEGRLAIGGGYIYLQSEGHPVEFRNIAIRPLD